jgi:teichuronic acid biosynthesis glycosyltransferase TuaH
MKLVVCSLEAWDHVWRRNQYLIDALLAADPSLEVLFVEPPSDPAHALLHGRRPRRGLGLRAVPGYGGRLGVLQPTKPLPRQLGPMADAALQRSVIETVHRLGWIAPVLWVNDPHWSGLVERTGWPAVYDITDDWAVADRGAREHDRLAAADVELLRLSARVVVCSPALAKRKGAERAVELISNAVDTERYRSPAPRPADLPAGPVALYVGTLHEDRLDVDLVARTGARLAASGGTLVLLGPNALAAANRERLDATPGIGLLGSRPRDDVPAYLQHAHALLVPHITDRFTDSLDPLKLYEYLAVGRPIVSTPVAGFRELAGTPGVTVAAGADFTEAVAAAVAAWRTTTVHSGLPSWADRAAQMRRVLDEAAGVLPEVSAA